MVNFRRIPLSILEHIGISTALPFRNITLLCFFVLIRLAGSFSLLRSCHKQGLMLLRKLPLSRVTRKFFMRRTTIFLTRSRKLHRSLVTWKFFMRRTTISIKNFHCFFERDVPFRFNLVKGSITQIGHERLFRLVVLYFHG